MFAFSSPLLKTYLFVETDSIKSTKMGVMSRRRRRRHFQLRRRRQLVQSQRIRVFRQRIARERRIRTGTRQRNGRLRYRNDVISRICRRNDDFVRGQRSAAKEPTARKNRTLVVHDPVVRAGAVLAGLGRLSFRWKISLLVSLLLNFSSPSMVRQKTRWKNV
jgi:hypothetical protein